MGQIGSALTELNDPPILEPVCLQLQPRLHRPQPERRTPGPAAAEDLFTVVHERFLTDTAKYADIVLPADTAMEHGDLAASYGNLCIQKTDPVIAPLGESKSNFETFALLGRAMGFTEDYFHQTNEELKDAVLAAPTPWRERLSAGAKEQFAQGRAVLLPQDDPCALQPRAASWNSCARSCPIRCPVTFRIPAAAIRCAWWWLPIRPR